MKLKLKTFELKDNIITSLQVEENVRFKKLHRNINLKTVFEKIRRLERHSSRKCLEK